VYKVVSHLSGGDRGRGREGPRKGELKGDLGAINGQSVMRH
jgi:hypothetical protein